MNLLVWFASMVDIPHSFQPKPKFGFKKLKSTKELKSWPEQPRIWGWLVTVFEERLTFGVMQPLKLRSPRLSASPKKGLPQGRHLSASAPSLLLPLDQHATARPDSVLVFRGETSSSHQTSSPGGGLHPISPPKV